MTKKANIKQLLKMELSGWETGLLELEERYRVGSGEEPVFTLPELEQLKEASFKSRENIGQYNRLMGLDDDWMTLRLLAQVDCLEVANTILIIEKMYHRATEHRHLGLNRISAPVILTQKQYSALRERQREQKLKEAWTVGSTAQTEAEHELPNAEPADVEEWLANEPETYLKHLHRLLEDIREKRLKVRFENKQKSKLRKLLAPPEPVTPEYLELLDEATLSASELYELEYPSIRHWIDTYIVGLYEWEEFTGMGVAVLQEDSNYLSHVILDDDGRVEEPVALNRSDGPFFRA